LNKPTAQTVGFFFGFGPAQCAFTSLRDMSLRRNPSAVASARRNAPSRRCAT
jgi:hypothetical protein